MYTPRFPHARRGVPDVLHCEDSPRAAGARAAEDDLERCTGGRFHCGKRSGGEAVRRDSCTVEGNTRGEGDGVEVGRERVECV